MPKIPAKKDRLNATYIVAAPDSNNANRADYQVPIESVNAEQTINQAINDLPASGGKIILLEGIYTISAPIVLLDNVTIEGFREATTITIPDGLDIDINAIENDDTAGGNDNLTILNLNINLNKANQTAGTMNCIRFDVCYNVRIERCRTGFARNNGIYFQGGNQLTAIENRTDNNDNDGIYYGNTDGAGIYQNLSYLNGNNGIELNALNRPSVVSNNACIQNSVNGIGFFSLTKALITNNACRNNGDKGIVSFAGDYSQVNDNVCADNGTHGIDLISSQYCTCNNNNCISNTNDGIVLDGTDDTTVANNEITDNERFGINIFSSSYNNIIGNTVINSSVGTTNTNDNIFVSGSAGDPAEYNNIQENKVRSGGNARYGINLGSNATNIQCTNNDFRDGGVTGNFNDTEGNSTTPGNIPNGGASVSAIGAKVQRTTNVDNITDFNIVTIDFESEIFDTDNMWDSGNADRLTAQTAGYYIVNGVVNFNISPSSTDSWAVLFFRKNGTIFQQDEFTINDNNEISYASMSALVQMAAGDYLTFQFAPYSVGNDNSDLLNAKFSAFMIAPTT